MILVEQFFRFLAPHDCIHCHKEGFLLCKDCSFKELEIIPSRCYRCYRTAEAYKTCRICRSNSVLRSLSVRTSYSKTAKEIVHALKFTYAKDGAKLIASELSALLPKQPGQHILVHVPAASSRVRLRGFDQSALIARELARMSGARHIHLLARVGQQRQVGSNVLTRREQMKTAFRPLSRGVIEGARIILIDDVLTTGSTMEAAALALKRAGAKTVDGLIFAQAK